jgi:hypothetical protein
MRARSTKDSTRIPKFEVLERRRGLVAQGFPVRSGCIFYDAAQGAGSLERPMLKPIRCLQLRVQAIYFRSKSFLRLRARAADAPIIATLTHSMMSRFPSMDVDRGATTFLPKRKTLGGVVLPSEESTFPSNCRGGNNPIKPRTRRVMQMLDFICHFNVKAWHPLPGAPLRNRVNGYSQDGHFDSERVAGCPPPSCCASLVCRRSCGLISAVTVSNNFDDSNTSESSFIE